MAWQHFRATLACLLVILKHTSLAPITETLNAEPVYSVEHPSRSLILIFEDSPEGCYDLAKRLSHYLYFFCQRAKLRAGIKPTALCSAFDKENSIEFPLDFLHYLYNYYMVCALFSHACHVTYHVMSCDVTL